MKRNNQAMVAKNTLACLVVHFIALPNSCNQTIRQLYFIRAIDRVSVAELVFNT